MAVLNRRDGLVVSAGRTNYPDTPWYLQNNSIMQEASGQVCRNGFGLSPAQVNPFLWGDGGVCLSTADDDGDGIHDDCAALASVECTAGNAADESQAKGSAAAS